MVVSLSLLLMPSASSTNLVIVMLSPLSVNEPKLTAPVNVPVVPPILPVTSPVTSPVKVAFVPSVPDSSILLVVLLAYISPMRLPVTLPSVFATKVSVV